MVRPAFFLWFALAVASLPAADLGRTDRLWRDYLHETVRRGQPLLVTDPLPGVVPFWPAITRARAEAESLEPGPDATLISAWIDQAEGHGGQAVASLRAAWPRPGTLRWPVRVWGETLFSLWEPRGEPAEWTASWLAWNEKAYSPRGLLVGIEAMEITDPSAVVPLLAQALALYPEDRRFLPVLLRHPEGHPATVRLVARDVIHNGGWDDGTLRALMVRAPQTKPLLVEAGYPAGRLDGLLAQDYGSALSRTNASFAPGAWSWDADRDGFAESRLVLDDAGLVTWTKRTSEGFWTLSVRDGQPEQLVERRLGATWTLKWESYPLASSLEYHWGDQTLVYRFRPLTQAVPLWPAERTAVPTAQWPAVLADQWLPLDPRGLAAAAASVETWNGDLKIQTVLLYRGEVWLQVQDTNRDGVDDLFSYFRNGRLFSVYSDPGGRGQASLRELYDRGELVQVQSRSPTSPRTEFVLFPQNNVQLWDPHGDRRPLERLFLWKGSDRLNALVFSRQELPWETMPVWEERP